MRKVAAGVALAALLLFIPALPVRSSASGTPNPLCASSPCAPEITGWLHTAAGSTKVYDANGSVVPLLGINVDGLDFGTGNPAATPDSCGKGYSVPSTSFADAASWGFNFVRVPITWENLEPTAPTLASNGTWIHHWNGPFLAELDTVAERFAQRRIAVMWDFAQVDLSAAFQQAPEKVQGGECEGWGVPTWLFPGTTSPSTSSEIAQAMCDFFNDRSQVGNGAPAPLEGLRAVETMLAARYSLNSSVIGIDMFNEPWFDSSCGPTASDGALLTSFYTDMGHAIEAANPHLLVAFEEPPSGLMSQSPILSSPPSVANAIYSYHIYTGSWSAAQPYMQKYTQNAGAWGVPSWMGEFNDFEAGCTGPSCSSFFDANWQADSDALLAYCASNGINWSFFSYYSLGTSVATPVPRQQILDQLRSYLPLSPASTTSTLSTASSATTTPMTSSSTPTKTASTSSVSVTTTQSQTTANSGAGGIPVFPGPVALGVAFAALLSASYLVIRRRRRGLP